MDYQTLASSRDTQARQALQGANAPGFWWPTNDDLVSGSEPSWRLTLTDEEKTGKIEKFVFTVAEVQKLTVEVKVRSSSDNWLFLTEVRI